MNDQTLNCRDCGQDFTFTAGEQDFYSSRGFTEPTRCPSCRAARKAERGGGSYSTGGYSRDSYSTGGATGGATGGGYGRSDREMFTVTCSSCGQDAQVPFQPRGDKPVYCSDCFRQRSGGAGAGGAGGAGGGRRRY